MEWFTIELVSNASAQLFPDIKLSSFAKFLPEELNPEGQREVVLSKKSYPSRHQNVTGANLMFLDKKLSRSSKFYYLGPCVYLSIFDIVKAMNTLIQESHNHNQNCITAKVSPRTQKVEIYFAIERSDLAFFSRGLEGISGSNVGNESRMTLR